MSLMQMLYQTYEYNSHMVGSDDGGIILSPIAHMQVNSQIEVLLSSEGNFVSARKVDKDDSKILIPVTEASAGRSSGIAPHVLSDTISYIAGDYENYVNDEKEKKLAHNRYEAYIAQLKKWEKSTYSHSKVHAIYLYLSKKKLISDLIASGIVKIEKGVIIKEKIGNKEYKDVLIRFIVFSDKENDIIKSWEDSSLIENYVHYFIDNQIGERNICQITGENSVITTNHPKGIVSSNYGAKLISANDGLNFTFRGRFHTSDEACTIGYEASQKAHNALAWLVTKQGITIGTQDKRTYLCWNPKGKSVPVFDDDFDEYIPDTNTTIEEGYKRKLFNAIQGNASNELEDNDDIVILALDAATTGRLSVVYYNELKYSCFFNRLYEWNSNVSWYTVAFTEDKKPYEVIKTPYAKSIVRFAFGTEQGAYVELQDKIFKEQLQRIYHCIIDGERVPKDIIHALVKKASNPQAYKYNYEKVLFTACALIKEEKIKEGRNNLMVLDENNIDRSYLFGRLLAVADVAEKASMNNNSDRMTNANRLQSAFVNRPFSTWNIIKNQLNPYLDRMASQQRTFYDNKIEDIMCLFKEDDLAKMNKALDDTYLLGYYLQRRDLRNRNKMNVSKEEE